MEAPLGSKGSLHEVSRSFATAARRLHKVPRLQLGGCFAACRLHSCAIGGCVCVVWLMFGPFVSWCWPCSCLVLCAFILREGGFVDRFQRQSIGVDA